MKCLLYPLAFLLFFLANASGQNTVDITRDFPACEKIKMSVESRNVTIKTWENNRIKVVVTISSGDSKIRSEEEWMDSLGIQMKPGGNLLEIKSRSFFDFDAVDVYSLGLEMQPGKKFISKEKDNVYYYDGRKMIPLEEAMRKAGKFVNRDLLFAKVALTLWVPPATTFDIKSDFGFLRSENELEQLELTTSNATVQAANIKHLMLTAHSSTLNFNSVGEASVLLTGSECYAQTIDTCAITSSGSSIDVQNLHTLRFTSDMDEYRIGELGTAEGTKNYGRFSIDLLTNSFRLKGQNANIRLRKFGSGATSFFLTDKFAQVVIPIKDHPSYALRLAGDGLSPSDGVLLKESRETGKGRSGSYFEASAGNPPHRLTLKINCDQCTVNTQ